MVNGGGTPREFYSKAQGIVPTRDDTLGKEVPPGRRHPEAGATILARPGDRTTQDLDTTRPMVKPVPGLISYRNRVPRVGLGPNPGLSNTTPLVLLSQT